MREPNISLLAKSLISADTSHRIKSMFEFGSGHGARDPQTSDVDLFVLVAKKSDITPIFTLINQLDDRILHWPHSRIKDFIERHFLGSNEVGGLHVIVVSNEELVLGRLSKSSNHRGGFAKSLRLRILTALLISEGVFLFKLKNQSKIMYGENTIKNITLPSLGWTDRVKCFSLSLVVLTLAPLSLLKRRKFIMWCFKATKYYADCIETYLLIKNGDNRKLPSKLRTPFYEEVKEYRYIPDKYEKSALWLYIRTWGHLFANIPFIWSA